MIAVRIPEEIRKYKEKIMLGLNARQLLATLIALFICVPLYWFGRKYMGDDTLSWIIIAIALPILAIGYFKFNGMPMERFVVAIFKHEFLFPRKRRYVTENAFRNWQNMALEEERPKTRREMRREEKTRKSISLERAALITEAEENGENINVDEVALLTVRTKKGKSANGVTPDGDENKNNNKKTRKTGFELLEEKAQDINKKMKNDPRYMLTKKERALMKKYHQTVALNRKKAVVRRKESIRKQNASMQKRRTARLVIPNSTQKSIPFIAYYDEGLFEITPNKFSKMYRLQDINYRIAREDEQLIIFSKLCEFLNYFGEDMRFAFTIDNRVISLQEQENKILYPLTGDEHDRHRTEYNNILKRQIRAGRNDIQVEKYLTVTTDADTPIEALLRFHKIDSEVIQNVRKIGSDAKMLSTSERLEYYHDKFRKGREGELSIDYDFIKTQGISSKDYIAPSSFEFNKNDMVIDNCLVRALYLSNLPASLSDEFLYELCDNDFPVTTTLSIQPVAQDKGKKIVQKQLTGIEKDKIDAEKRAIRSGYSPETIQHSIKDALAQAEALYDDMLNKNQKMFFVTITLLVYGADIEELNEHCKVVESKARKFTTQLMPLTYQQEEGYKITMPFGYPPEKTCVERTLTTESTAIFMPFSNQELFQPHGYYYGLNQISKNLIIVNRSAMKTPSGFVLGTSGSGKSFATKEEILNVLLHDNETSILIIDPENEYGDFCRAFGGTVLDISADSSYYINPMDMSEDYGLDEDDKEDISIDLKKSKALTKKSNFIMSLVEDMITTGRGDNKTTITPIQRTIVDQCVKRCYEQFMSHDFDQEYIPTLLDLQNELDKEKGVEDGRQVAVGVEYYTRGSMNVFANKTNVAVSNRLVVFNVRDLGDQLRQIALSIIFDFIWNRMVDNKNRGVRTYCYADEIHVMFNNEFSAEYLKQLYKRGRKYGLCITGLTQNVEDLLRTEKARGMIGNSDFIMMLNQNGEDLKLLAELLNISETQMGFVIGAEAGSGLIFAEKIIVPFEDRFPEDSYLYKLMSTRFGENMTETEYKIKTIIETTPMIDPNEKIEEDKDEAL
jgi:hypothetical protein